MKSIKFFLACICMFCGIAHADTKLVVASFYPVDQTAGMDGIVKAFEEQNPGVKIEFQVTPFDQYLPKILSQMAAGDPPDVIGVENTPFPQFVDKNVLLNLNDYLASSSKLKKEDFFQSLLERYTYNETVFGIPYDAQPGTMLFYNPAIYDKMGVSYPDENTTIEEYYDKLKKLTHKDGDKTIYGAAAVTWEQAVYGHGGRLVDDLRNPKMCMLNSPEAKEGLQLAVDMMLVHEAIPSIATIESIGGSTGALFYTGQAASHFNGFWDLVFNQDPYIDNSIKATVYPTKDLLNRTYRTGGTAYAITRNAKNPELAWKFIEMFMGKEGYENAVAASKNKVIYPPAHKPSYDWYMSLEFPFSDMLLVNEQMLPDVIFSPYDLNWPEISSKCINGDMDLILRGSKPVSETLDEICECVNKRLN